MSYLTVGVPRPRMARSAPPQMGFIPGLIKSALTAVGLRDPLATHEPGKTPQEIWAKYAPGIDYDYHQIMQIPRGSAQSGLLAAWTPLRALRDSISAYFRPGSTPGSNEIGKLGQLVEGMKALDREIRAARKQYGVIPGGPAAAPPGYAAPTARAGSGDGGILSSLLPIALLGGAAFLGLKAFKVI